MKKIPIFRKVHCKAYLKKFSDGIYLECAERIQAGVGYMENPVTGNCWDDRRDIRVKAVQSCYENGKWETKELADLSNFEGDSVEKQYRKRVEEPFDGFLVGITNIVTHGRIGTDYREEHYDTHASYLNHLTKDTKMEKVGVVYFKNNAKRYVLIDDMETIDE